MAVVKQSTMIAPGGDGRLGEVGRIRRGAWAPSLLVCGPWKYSDLRANTLSFPGAGDPALLLWHQEAAFTGARNLASGGAGV